jgi:hypothetical protein
MRKLVLILVLLFGISSVSFAMGSAPSAQAGNAQVEETQFIPRPAMKAVSPRIIPKAQTANILRPIAVTVTVTGFDTAAYTGRTPLPGANILVTDDNLTGPTKIAEGTSGTFNLIEGEPYRFSAVMTAYPYRPQFSVQYTASSATPLVQLQLFRINPFTTGMLATARPVKIRVLETGYLIDDPHPIDEAKVYLTRRVGDRFYGVETTTGADGYIPAYISIPYETDYEVYVFASDFGVLKLAPSPDFPYYIFAGPERKIYLKRLLLP